ncbi:MAG: aspartate 1-decarboxylase [Verrucomicrobia bacterium]|nr:aspartate 1-decarboxylase [Verrucomicrobiota bacterium]
MAEIFPRRLFLRSLLPRVKLTGVRSTPSPCDAGTVFLGPRLCWAAGLAELEQIEVANLTRGGRLTGRVGFGAEHQVVIADGPGNTMQPGDLLRISAYQWISATAVAGHTAIMAQVDANNALIEFRRMTSRAVEIDPTFRGPPPAIEVIVELPAPHVPA